MKIASASIYALRIPFAESFRHSLYERDCADSIVVRLTTDGGVTGFGEGAPRPYVTGETTADCVQHIRRDLLPRAMNGNLEGIPADGILAHIARLLPETGPGDGVVHNAARCAVELAMADCAFRALGESVAAALPPGAQSVTYSGVIPIGPTTKVRSAAQRCRAAGLRFVKVKVAGPRDVEQVALVREIMGPSVSIRLDANGCFDRRTAIAFLAAVAGFGIECIEQPLPRGDPAELAALRADSPVPVMVDESLLTVRDAAELIANRAADCFNLRASKCGGLHAALEIAGLARSAGIGIQVGCQAGETAILSAAGRHLAAHLGNLRFVEGSYGRHLLVEDISEQDIAFGQGGEAPILTGPGLGICVRPDLLEKYAAAAIRVR